MDVTHYLLKVYFHEIVFGKFLINQRMNYLPISVAIAVRVCLTMPLRCFPNNGGKNFIYAGKLYV